MRTMPDKAFLTLSRKLLLAVAVAASLSIVSSLCDSGICLAADTAIGNDELVTILRATKVVPSDSKLSASISGDEVVVTTLKKDGSTDEGTKIQAVLIAKTVFDSVKNDAQRTKIIFFDFANNSFSEVAVKRAEVKLYGSGQLTERELLSSLEVRKGNPNAEIGNSTKAFKVSSGHMEGERVLLRGRLDMLEEAGSNVKDLRQQFEQLEQVAHNGSDEETHELYETISMSAAVREKAFKDAQRRQSRLDERATSVQGQQPFTAGKAMATEMGGGDRIWKLFMNPKTNTNMYNFGVADMPQPKHGRGPLVFYMYEIQTKARQSDVKNLVDTMNAAIHAYKTNDSNQYNNCLELLRKQLGEPSPGNKNANPFGGPSQFSRSR